jgi:bifunctional non-homologous end joining protein LigD
MKADHSARSSARRSMFVIQEHHARRLHWDFRLERDGVLVSWAVPKGMPMDPKSNRLAVRTEDHPLDYATFAGEIPKGEYGGGRVHIWDRGTYETEKWTDDEVKVVLRGDRIQGRYVLFRTGGDNWMVHRMDPPLDPEWRPLPAHVPPMLAVTGELPRPAEDDRWGYEMKWDGVRAVVYVEGGQARVLSRSDRDITVTYPELRQLAEQLGARQCVLDGEIVAFDDSARPGRPSFAALQPRMQIGDAARARRLAQHVPATFLAFDLLHLDGRDTVSLPYRDRRDLLESLDVNGPRWSTPPWFHGSGAAALETSRAQGLEGVVAKRLDSPYLPGRRSDHWRKIKLFLTAEVVIGGWKPGAGRRAGGIGSLLIGVPTPAGLEYVGHVGTGFTEPMLDDLARLLHPLARRTSPFVREVPRQWAKDAHWVTPQLVGEVRYGERTKEGRLRAPSWRGLRPDKRPEDINPE